MWNKRIPRLEVVVRVLDNSVSYSDNRVKARWGYHLSSQAFEGSGRHTEQKVSIKAALASWDAPEQSSHKCVA